MGFDRGAAARGAAKCRTSIISLLCSRVSTIELIEYSLAMSIVDLELFGGAAARGYCCTKAHDLMDGSVLFFVFNGNENNGDGGPRRGDGIRLLVGRSPEAEAPQDRRERTPPLASKPWSRTGSGTERPGRTIPRRRHQRRAPARGGGLCWMRPRWRRRCSGSSESLGAERAATSHGAGEGVEMEI